MQDSVLAHVHSLAGAGKQMIAMMPVKVRAGASCWLAVSSVAMVSAFLPWLIYRCATLTALLLCSLQMSQWMMTSQMPPTIAWQMAR